jgi:hypothetical protein
MPSPPEQSASLAILNVTLNSPRNVPKLYSSRTAEPVAGRIAHEQLQFKIHNLKNTLVVQKNTVVVDVQVHMHSIDNILASWLNT